MIHFADADYEKDVGGDEEEIIIDNWPLCLTNLYVPFVHHTKSLNILSNSNAKFHLNIRYLPKTLYRHVSVTCPNRYIIFYVSSAPKSFVMCYLALAMHVTIFVRYIATLHLFITLTKIFKARFRAIAFKAVLKPQWYQVYPKCLFKL